MHTELLALRDALAEIDVVQTCKLGYEQGISPDQYPIVRLVPTQVLPAKYGVRTVELGIVFGVPVSEAEGLEAIYAQLLALELDIIAVVKEYGGRYTATLADEDRISSYKLMQVQCEIETARPDAPD